jgi:four helix bundle protein
VDIKCFRDLYCWQKAMALVTGMYRVTGLFPREELYGLTSRARRCTVSILNNIVEGFGQLSSNDYIRQ